MTRNAFMKHIKKAHKKLDMNYLDEGCCCALESLDIYHLFSNILCPTDSYMIDCEGIDINYCYWLGDFTRENLPLRHHFIDMFAGIVLADKGYKDLYRYYISGGWLK